MSESLRILYSFASGEALCAREVADKTGIAIQRVSTRTNMMATRGDLSRVGCTRPIRLKITATGLERLSEAEVDFAAVESIAMVERAIRSRPALAMVWGQA